MGRFVLDGRLRQGWLSWVFPCFLGTRKKSICRIFGSKKEEGQTIYRFGLPCTMFGFCDESPEANPHNPIFCGVFPLDPCCELCCGGMEQISKATVKIPSGNARAGISHRGVGISQRAARKPPCVSHCTGTATPLCVESRCELCSLFHRPLSGCAFHGHAARSSA